MQLVTLSDLKTSVSRKADMENSAFVASAEYIEVINSALSKTHDLLVNTYEDYFLSRVEIPIAASQEEYVLPEDLLKLKAVLYLGSNDSKIMLNRWDFRDLATRSSTIVTIDQFGFQDIRYRILNNKLVLNPIPAATGTLEIWYVPQFKKLINDNDIVSWEVPVGWEDYCKYLATAECLAKEESDNSFWIGMAAKEEQRILENAPERDTGNPGGWKDVYGADTYSDWEY